MQPAEHRFENRTILYLLLGAVGVNLFTNYFLLRDVYRPHNTDDPWSMYFAYNYVVNGSVNDAAFVGPNPGDTEGTAFFRKTHALVYGHILSVFGWTYNNGQRISTALVFLAAAFWIPVLRKLGYERVFCAVFAALFLYLEFSFMAAAGLRQEALLLFFQSLAFCLFLHRRYFWAGLVYAIAMETHPVALMSLAYPLAWTLVRRPWETPVARWKGVAPDCGFLLAGAVAGIFYYVWLHPVNPADVAHFLSGHTGNYNKNVSSALGVLGQYFFLTKYYRHVPELVLLVFSLYLCFSRGLYKSQPFVLVAFALFFILSFLRHNSFYAILIYPVLILVILAAFSAIRRVNLLLFLTLLLMAPQYFYVYHLNGGWDRDAYFATVKKLAPAGDPPLVGNAMTWFALMDRKNFKTALVPADRFAEWNPPEVYLLEDRFLAGNEIYSRLLAYIRAHYQGVPVRAAEANGQKLVLLRMIRR